MISFLKQSWDKVCDQSQDPSARFFALLCLLSPVFAVVVLVVLAVWFFEDAMPCLLAGGILLWAVVGDPIERAIERRRIAQDERIMAELQWLESIYRRIAAEIVPLVAQVTALDLEPEDIFYNVEIHPQGQGIYFLPPHQLDEQECLNLRRSIIRRLCGRTGIPRSQMYEGNNIVVAPDYIYIRALPQIIHHYST